MNSGSRAVRRATQWAVCLFVTLAVTAGSDAAIVRGGAGTTLDNNLGNTLLYVTDTRPALGSLTANQQRWLVPFYSLATPQTVAIVENGTTATVDCRASPGCSYRIAAGAPRQLAVTGTFVISSEAAGFPTSVQTRPTLDVIWRVFRFDPATMTAPVEVFGQTFTNVAYDGQSNFALQTDTRTLDLSNVVPGTYTISVQFRFSVPAPYRIYQWIDSGTSFPPGSFTDIDNADIRRMAPTRGQVLDLGTAFAFTSTTGLVIEPALAADSTAPSSTLTLVPSPNAGGWNNTAVAATLAATDPAVTGATTSGLKLISYTGTNANPLGNFASSSPTSPAGFTIDTEGSTTLQWFAEDVAGNREASRSRVVNLDFGNPTISASLSPTPTAEGWNAGPVTVSFACADALSGVASCSDPVTVAGAGGGQPVSGSATDRAGNVATTDVTVNVDTTPPTIGGTRLPPANGAGWNSSGVTVSFACADPQSGIRSCPAPFTLTSEGADQSWSGTAANRAGLSAQATVSGIAIDGTAPTITGTASPAASAGWNNGPVTVSFDCSDTLSGIADGACPAPVVLAGEGAGQSASGSVSDRAGNPASTTVTGIAIDRTPPVVGVTGVTSGATYVRGSVPAAGCTTTDALSGVATPATLTTSPANANGVGSVTATCGGATDRAGNTASASVTYRVAYAFQGFFRPIDNAPVFNRVNAGQAIPVKFSLGGNFGTNVLAAGSPGVQTVGCSDGAPIDDVEETVAAGSSALVFDAASGQYVYVWKTARSFAGSCRALVLTLNDGTTRTALFRFR